jgi:hypothetical protein
MRISALGRSISGLEMRGNSTAAAARRRTRSGQHVVGRAATASRMAPAAGRRRKDQVQSYRPLQRKGAISHGRGPVSAFLQGHPLNNRATRWRVVQARPYAGSSRRRRIPAKQAVSLPEDDKGASFVHFTPPGTITWGAELPQSFPCFSGFALPRCLLVAQRTAASPPYSLVGLRTWGPLLMLVLAGTLALAFNRGRVVFAVVSLIAAFVAYRLHLHDGLAPFSARTLFAAICLFVPLNLATLSVLLERGAFTFYGARRLGSIALQAAVTAWVIDAQRTEVTEWIYRPWIEIPSLAGALIPQLALLVLCSA